MKKLLLLLLIFLSGCQDTEKSAEIGNAHIIPAPELVTQQSETFLIETSTIIRTSEDLANSAALHLLTSLIRPGGKHLPVQYELSAEPRNTIQLSLDGAANSLGPEGYTLTVNDEGITLTAQQPAGLFYAVQSLRQLLPLESEKQEPQHGNWLVKATSIVDRPRFRWRGFMLDCSRHFFQPQFIKEVIDQMAMLKLNTFHWHLVDDQGWRIEIARYPKLTEVGAWRVDRENLSWRTRPFPGEDEPTPIGGFYSQDDIREIVQYAADRHITVVPEIEMPAHVSSALAAYPHLSCSGGPFKVPPGSVWPIKDIYCAGE